MAIKEIFVPDLGGADKVDVIELNFKPGDQVQLDEGLVTLESDKATMEVPVTFAGTIKEFFVKVGDKLSEGDRVASVETQADESVVDDFFLQDKLTKNNTKSGAKMCFI